MPPRQDGIYARGEEWVHEGKEDGSRGGSSEPRVDLGNPRGARGAGKELLQGVTGFSGTEGSGASQALGCRPWPRGAGWVQAASSPRSVPLLAAPVPAWHLAVPRCSPSPGRDGGCTQRPPQNQNQPLSNSQLKLCLVNYSAAHSRCFSVLIRRAWRWGKGKKKHRKERERAAQGSKAAEVSKTEI